MQPVAACECGFCHRHVQRLDAVQGRDPFSGGDQYICFSCVREAGLAVATVAAGGTSERPDERVPGCRFCGKTPEQVEVLVVSPGSSSICSECIELSLELIDEVRQ